MKQLATVFLALLLLAGCARQKSESYIGIAEGRVYQVPALAGGLITQMNVDEGQGVAAGEVIAVVDTLNLHYQLNELDGALAELVAQHKVQQTQVAQARADLDYVSAKLARNEALVSQSALPEQSRDDLANLRDKARAQLDTGTQQLAALAAKRSQLEARRAQLRKAVADAVITAPAAGIVSARYLRRGEAAAPMKPVVEITALDEIETTIYVSETDLPSVRTGQKVSIHLDGCDQTMPGTVSWISPKAEFTPKQVLTPDNRTALVYAVRIVIPNPNGLIKHGMPVQVTR